MNEAENLFFSSAELLINLNPLSVRKYGRLQGSIFQIEFQGEKWLGLNVLQCLLPNVLKVLRVRRRERK